MSHPDFSCEPGRLIADTSVWISLVACGRITDILDAIGEPILTPQLVVEDLERGRVKGHQTAEVISGLIATGQVIPVPLSPIDEDVYLSLVSGAAVDTLHDGEAATLTLAFRLRATAMIDERKATALGSRRFPGLEIRSTEVAGFVWTGISA